MRILVVNAGSSSLKLSVLAPDDELSGACDLPAPQGDAVERDIADAIGRFGSVDAVGHRIVHGGTEFTGPVIIDSRVRSALAALTDLAPLHQPKSLAALDAVTRVLPETPAIACFDTAFHALMPASASTYALPAAWRRRWALRRYGFHGLSHAYASRRTAELLDRPLGDLRIVTCHLGAGASLAAVQNGRSVDTTMGFTPLDGLIMATRSGAVDPGLILWLQEHAGTPAQELAATLEYRSGLMGLAGTPDMREVIARAAAGDQDAILGFDTYIHRLRAGIASMAAAMNGLDALAFTGGVGENSPEVRAAAGAGLTFLGVAIEPAPNEQPTGDEIISAGGPAITLVKAREDLEIAHQVRGVLAGERR